jgi:hypothetical protein
MMDEVHKPVISEEQHITYQNRLQNFTFTNRCTYLLVLESTKLYTKIRSKMLLHVSVFDHHQWARTWAELKLQLLKMLGKNTSLWTCSGVAAYYVKSLVMCMLCAVQDETELAQVTSCTDLT